MKKDNSEVPFLKMKTLVRSSLRNGNRYFSTDRSSINLIKSNLLKDDKVLEKHKKSEFKILSQLGLSFNECTEDDVRTDDKSDFSMSTDTNFRVGHFPNQYPNIANANMAKFHQLFCTTNTALEHWIIDRQKLKSLALNIESTIDFHPFPLTNPSKQSNVKKSVKPWKLTPNENEKMIDSIDENILFLTRKLNKTQTQQLILYRDLHQNMSNMNKIEAMIKTFSPDKIILELSPDGGSIGLRSFTKFRFKYVVMPLLRMRQRMLRKHQSNECKVGERWLKMIRKLLCIVPPSYAQISAVNLAIENGIDIVCADYSERAMVGPLAFAESLDVYQNAILEKMKFPIKRLKQLMLSSDHLLGIKFLKLCAIRIQPHLQVVGSMRNDLMSLAVNECTEEKLLFILGESHCYDVMDRLTGKVKIQSPFKEVREQRVLLKTMTPAHFDGDCQVKLEDLTESDIQTAEDVLGKEAVALMTVRSADDLVNLK